MAMATNLSLRQLCCHLYYIFLATIVTTFKLQPTSSDTRKRRFSYTDRIHVNIIILNILCKVIKENTNILGLLDYYEDNEADTRDDVYSFSHYKLRGELPQLLWPR